MVVLLIWQQRRRRVLPARQQSVALLSRQQVRDA